MLERALKDAIITKTVLER